MTDGRGYTPEDSIDQIHEDLGRARRHLHDLEQAGAARIVDEAQHVEQLRRARERVLALEAELQAECASMVAAAEGFVS